MRTSIIGQKRQKFWAENGFLVLPSFFTEEEVAAVDDAAGQAWDESSDTVVVDDLVTNRRARMSELSEEEKTHSFKVNDLYLTDTGLREVAISERVGMVLSELLEDEPVLCNTLTFDRGSQQADHVDTLYMTPRTDSALVATWIALEDTVPEAGPLRYYPGSNHIEPYRFKTGGYHVELDEMLAWSDYMAGEVERHGLEETRFLAQRGDLFVWHAGLLHGGSEIADPSLTRRSLVSHYFTQSDCEVLGSDLRPAPGGWWMHKPPLDVPSAPSPDVGAQVPEAARPSRSLFERMRALLTATD